MAETRRNCELCDGEATTYCPSDNAFLCNGCDEKVHGANFLVARHVRSHVCPRCRNFDGGCRFSGAGAPHVGSMKMMCASCSPHVEDDGDVDDDALSSSSSCVSSTGEEPEVGTASASSASSRGKRSEYHHHHHHCSGAEAVVVVDAKVEGILVNWCTKMVVEDTRVVKMAVELVRGYMSRTTVLPFRVLLAAALWAAIRLCYDGVRLSTCHELRRLEQISGVPAKLITAMETRLARVIRRRRSREDHEEGWAEC